MKTLIALFVLFTSTQSFAQTDNGKLPVCKIAEEETMSLPCRMPKKEAGVMIADMMFSNRKGFNATADQAAGVKTGNTAGFMIEGYRVSLLKEEITRLNGRHLTTTTVQYEVLLNDCRGTDACNESYLWTVNEVVKSDGYTYQSQFRNELTQTKIDELDPEVATQP